MNPHQRSSRRLKIPALAIFMTVSSTGETRARFVPADIVNVARRVEGKTAKTRRFDRGITCLPAIIVLIDRDQLAMDRWKALADSVSAEGCIAIDIGLLRPKP